MGACSPCSPGEQLHSVPHAQTLASSPLTLLALPGPCAAAAVVEVTTSRTSNVERHREIQAAVKQAVSRALQQLEPPSPAPAAGSPVGRGGPGEAAVPASCCLPFELAVQAASYQRYSLPLAQPLTTPAADDGSGQQQPQRRCGLLLQVSLAGPGGSVAHGVGEVAPLPGLHAELLQAAEQQLALLCQLMSSTVRVPLTVALLGGRLADWLQQGLGVAPDTLLPSVRCGLEAAVLSAIAQASRRWQHVWCSPHRLTAASSLHAPFCCPNPGHQLICLLPLLLPPSALCSTRVSPWRSCFPPPRLFPSRLTPTAC